MNEKDEESERDADYKEWNYWQEQMNEKDEEGCEGGCVCCGFETHPRHYTIMLKPTLIQ